jgi:hypothetical protein
VYAQHALQFLTRMLSMVCRDLFQILNFYAYAEHTGKKLVRMLSIRVRIRISSWCVCSAFFEGNALCAGISTCCVPYAQCTHQFLTRMLSVRISS